MARKPIKFLSDLFTEESSEFRTGLSSPSLAGVNVTLGGGNDNWNGTVNDDTVDGGAGNDTLNGGNGNDWYYLDNDEDRVIESSLAGAGSADTVVLGAGFRDAFGRVDIPFSNVDNVERFALNNSLGETRFFGNAGDNYMIGNNSANYLAGGIGFDTLEGGRGNDTFYASTHDDVISKAFDNGTDIDTIMSDFDFSIDADVVVPDLFITLANGQQQLVAQGTAITANANQATISRYDSVTGTLFGIDNLVLNVGRTYGRGNDGNNSLIGSSDGNYLFGDDGNDTILGGDGGDAISGGNGNDYLDGQGDFDTLLGGAGSDTYVVNFYSDWVEDVANNGTDRDTLITSVNVSIQVGLLNIADSTGLTSGISIPRAVINEAGVAQIENVILAGTATSVIGNDLNNQVTGNDLGNNIYVGSGNDTVFGGIGLDTIFGELGNDYINGQADTDFLFGNGGQDTLMGEGGDDSAVGGGGNDWLEGGVGQDDLRGNNNNDTLIGGDDSDLLTGGFANDLLFGDAMADTLSAVGGNDTLLAGSGDDTVYGGGGNDAITGGAGNDWLHGGAGNDTFFNTAGGQRLSGVDTLIGGAGDDTLTLQPLSWGRQVVSFDDVVANVGGRNVIQGVDQVNNFQGDLIDSSGQVINVGGVPVRGPAQNLADQLDLGGLFDQLGYAATNAARQGAVDIRSTTTAGLFEVWVDANATATVDFQLAARVQVTSGTIDLTENIILL